MVPTLDIRGSHGTSDDVRPSILVDGHVFDMFHQGTRSYLKGLYRALSELGLFRIVVAANKLDVLAQEFSGCKNIEFRQIPFTNTVDRLFRVYPRLTRELGPDFCHFQYVGPVRCTGRLVITSHDVLFADFPDQFPWHYRMVRNVSFRYSARMADVLLTVSDYSKDRISQVLGIDAERIHVVSNAVSDEGFATVPRQVCSDHVEGKWGLNNFALYVGRVEPRKNHHLLVKAFRECGLFRQGISLVFIGKRDLANPLLDKEIALLDAQERERLVMLEGISDADLLHFYGACRLFLFPSFGEGFGMPVLEAAAAGAPVLSSNATAMGRFGLPQECLFDPADEQEFYRKLRGAIQDGSRLLVPPAVLERYRWRNSAREFADILQARTMAARALPGVAG